MKLAYWTAECLNDSKAYSIREKTRKAALAKLAEMGLTWNEAEGEWQGESGYAARYGDLHKVEVHYADGFDLLKLCLSEGGGYWE